jgi:RNA ligase-like protein
MVGLARCARAARRAHSLPVPGRNSAQARGEDGLVTFFRFPRTPHIAVLGKAGVRGDKVLAPQEAIDFLAEDVIVEEKVDGANVGFSIDGTGELRAQNRGSFISQGAKHAQFRPLFTWMGSRRDALKEALGCKLLLFGEWCFAVHSIHYDRLPDWFLAFDVYDRASGRFWSVDRRNELVRVLGLAGVPRVADGRFDLAGLQRLLGKSMFSGSSAEGLHIRREDGGWLVGRAKLVRPEFLNSIDEHWTRRPLRTNSIAPIGVRP